VSIPYKVTDKIVQDFYYIAQENEHVGTNFNDGTIKVTKEIKNKHSLQILPEDAVH
jgi:hypothetical protein